MSSATEQFRAGLDERGVKWEAFDDFEQTTQWSTHNGAFVYWARERDGKLLVETTAPTKCSASFTPEQAIIATLGTGTCRLVETEHEQEIFDGGYYSYWSYDCDECGHENTEYGRFCAGCGAKVVGE